jgi:hypothetical protein
VKRLNEERFMERSFFMSDDRDKLNQQSGQQGHQGNPPGQNQPQPGQQREGQKQDDKRPTHGQNEEDEKFNKERRAS